MKCKKLKNNILNKRIYILVILWSLFLTQTSSFLSAKDGLGGVKSYFICKSGASIKIKRASQLVLKSNLRIESDIVGAGELVMNSKEETFIDAHEHSIENLILTSYEKVELFSGLKIVNKLKVVHASLLLNDYSLTLNKDTDFETYRRIIQNGIGVIIEGFLDFNTAIPSKVVNSLVHNFSQSPILRNSNRSFIIISFCDITPIVLDRAIRVIVPPPQFS